MKTTDSVMSQEVNKCDFCGEVKPVLRHYLYVKNKHFDDNKGGCYSTFVSYCQDCGIDSHSLAEARREAVDECMKYQENPTYELREKILSDLLTGDNPESECKVCHRTSDVVDMSKCPFCEHDQELIKEGRAMSDFDTRRGE